jgi:hypothetical protein
MQFFQMFLFPILGKIPHILAMVALIFDSIRQPYSEIKNALSEKENCPVGAVLAIG